MTSGIKIEWEEPGPAEHLRLLVEYGPEYDYRDPTEADLTRALELLAPEVRGRVIEAVTRKGVPPLRPERESVMAEHMRRHGLPEAWAEWAKELRVNFDRAIGYRMTVSGHNGEWIRCSASDPSGPWRSDNRSPWCPTGIRADGMIDPDPAFNDAGHWMAVAEKAERERDVLKAKLAEATTHPRSFVCDEEMRAALFADCAAAKRRGDALEKELAESKDTIATLERTRREIREAIDAPERLTTPAAARRLLAERDALRAQLEAVRKAAK